MFDRFDIWILPILLVVVAAWTGLSVRKQRRRMDVYYQRPCAGVRWRRGYPKCSSDDVRVFLKVVVGSFQLQEKKALTLRPDDRVMDLYHAAAAPDLWGSDAMEVEDFVGELQREYGVTLEQHWREGMTLGEVFVLTLDRAGG